MSKLDSLPIQLTDSVLNRVGSAFRNEPVPADAWRVVFNFSVTGPGASGTSGDGIAFVMQNDARGPAALGTSGSIFSGISNAFAVTFNTRNAVGDYGCSIGFSPTGNRVDVSSSMSFASGNVFSAVITYTQASRVLTVALTEEAASSNRDACPNANNNYCSSLPGTTVTASFSANLFTQLGCPDSTYGCYAYIGATAAVSLVC